MRAVGTRTAVVAAELLDFFSGQVQRIFGSPGGSMHDPLAVAALVAPDVLTFQPMHVAVELRGEHTYGMTVCDARNIRAADLDMFEASVRRSAPPNASVATAVNPERFWDLFLDVLRTYP